MSSMRCAGFLKETEFLFFFQQISMVLDYRL